MRLFHMKHCSVLFIFPPSFLPTSPFFSPDSKNLAPFVKNLAKKTKKHKNTVLDFRRQSPMRLLCQALILLTLLIGREAVL